MSEISLAADAVIADRARSVTTERRRVRFSLIVVAVAFLGLGIGLSFASMANLIVDAVPQRQTGEATGMNTIMRTIGGAFGGQIAAAMGAVAVALACGAALLIPGRVAPDAALAAATGAREPGAT